MMINIYPSSEAERNSSNILSDEYSDVVAIRCDNGDLIIEQSNRKSINEGMRLDQNSFDELISKESQEESDALLKMNESELDNHFKKINQRKDEFFAKIAKLK